MSKWVKRVLSVLLVCMLVGGAMPLGVIPANAAAKTGDDGIINWDFIEPVTHLTSAPAGYTEIRTAQQLSNIRNDLWGNYILMNDIDLAAWGNWQPIGTYNAPFRGAFDGNGYVVRNMKIESNMTGLAYVGLFGSTATPANTTGIKNLGVVNCYINVKEKEAYVGGVLGFARDTRGMSLYNCYVTGEINAVASITKEHWWDDIYVYNGYMTVGGVCGYIYDDYLYNCYNASSINVTDAAIVGGVVGGNGFLIAQCYNTGNITVRTMGYDADTDFSILVGGVFGTSSFSVTNTYNLGNINVITDVAVLLGGIGGQKSYSVNSSYNIGNLATTSQNPKTCVGGILGSFIGPNIWMRGCYYINENIPPVVGYANGIDETERLTLAQMKQVSSFAGFDFYRYWDIDPAINSGYPHLRPETLEKKAIIVVPGIAGSELYAKDYIGYPILDNEPPTTYPNVDSKVWAPNTAQFLTPGSRHSISDNLRFKEDANRNVSPNNPTVYAASKSDDSFGAVIDGQGVFTSLVKGLREKYDPKYGGGKNGQIYEVSFFPYDWRFPNSNAAYQLYDYITDYAKGYTEVIIVAHSMGGLVASAMIGYYGYNSAGTLKLGSVKLDKLITIGTPYLGSPKALYVFETGNFLDGWLTQTASNGVFKKMCPNVPGIYELLPSERYFENNKYYLTKSNEPQNYEQTKQYFEGRTSAWYNSKVFTPAAQFHKSLNSTYDKIIDGSINAYVIIGNNVKTIWCLKTADKAGKPVVVDLDIELGDGTVPLLSASLGYADARMARRPYYVDGVSHTALVSNRDCIQLVQNIVENKGDTANYKDGITSGIISHSQPTATAYTGYKIIAACPVDLTISDMSNRWLGTVTSEMIDATDGHYFDFYNCGEDNDIKIAFVDNMSKLEIEGTGAGTMDFTIEQFVNGAIIKSVEYTDVPITDTTIIKTDTNLNDPKLDVDSNGDGTTDTVIRPDSHPSDYAVTVTNGTGNGSFAAGSTVTITANTAPSGQRFKQWNITPSVNFTGGTSATSFTAQFTMPAQAVAATAVYENLPADQYAINVQTDGNGTASASVNSATQGTEITLTATANSGYRFKQWQVISGGVTVTNNKFTMPANTVTVKAIFETTGSGDTKHALTVVGGSGSGEYAAGVAVPINANVPSGKVFDKWSATTGTITNPTSASTTFTMPTGAATVTATFKDAPKGIFGTNAKWYGAWWHYILFFFALGFIWMWF